MSTNTSVRMRTRVRISRTTKFLGAIGIFSVTAITVNLWLLSKPSLASVTARPFLSLGQLTALIGGTLLSLNYVLSARLRFLEPLFGGLDRAYLAHRFLGMAGFISIVYHPAFLAVNSFRAGGPALNFFLPSADVASSLGVFALFGYIVLIAATLFIKLPYHMWRLTHKLMGVPLFLFAAHVYFIPSDTSRYLPLRVWMLGLVAAGIASYVYKVFLYGKFGPRYSYAVESIALRNDFIDVVLQPKGRRLEFSPGQFAYVSFKNRAVGREPHPFSISSGPNEPTIRFSVKSVGDYTDRLKLLRAGDEAVLHGPYGVFGEEALHSGKDQLWIAGGIGVTPFLSMLRHLPLSRGPRIWFFYCTRSAVDAVYLPEIIAGGAGHSELEVIHHNAEAMGKIDYSNIECRVGELADKKIFLCGPPPMMESLVRQFVARGVRPRNIIYEKFSFIT